VRQRVRIDPTFKGLLVATRPVPSLWIMALAIIALILRTFDLGSFPRWFTDEGLWSMPPRDFVLFSYWTLGPWYHFYLSPLFTGLLVPWFAAFGPGVVQARAFNALLGVGSVGAVMLLGRRLGLGAAAFFAAAALAVDGDSITVNRSVLLESLQTLLLLGCAIIAVGQQRLREPLLATCFAAALLTKLLSVYVGPVLLLYAWWSGGRRFFVRDLLTLLGGLGLACVVFGLIAASGPERFASVWQGEFSIRAMVIGTQEHSAALRATLLYFMVHSPLLLVGVFGASVWLAMRRCLSPGTGIAALWTIFGISAMSVQGYTPARYFTPIVPFAWLWVFATVQDMFHVQRLARARIVMWGLVGLSALYTIGSQVGYYFVIGNDDTRGPAIARFLDSNVPPGERVLAPLQFVVSTHVVALGFDSAPETLRAGQLVTSELRRLNVRYVVTAPDTPQAPTSVEPDSNGYLLVANFGDLKLYQTSS
jgi:4-amino-4-deoxy-L-arabinose transferase-like glycosyltransferase